jgi:hypothetical protein
MTDRYPSAGWPEMWPHWLLNPQPNPFAPSSWPNDPDEPAPSKGRGILADFDHWGQEPSPRFSSGGLLAPLDRINVWDQANQAAPWPPAPRLHPLLSQPAAFPSLPEPDSAGIASPPAPYLKSAKYWGVGPSASMGQDRSAYGSYLSPVPQPVGWESLGSNVAGATPNFSELPSPLSWGEGIAPPVDEVASAQEARAIAAQRLARRNRPAAPENVTSPQPTTGAYLDTPGFRERTRLNFQDSYYRGTLLGASRLGEYRQIMDDLAHYDRMRSSVSAGDLGAAALGQLGGGMLSPESWLGLGVKGATSLGRVAKAALQQGAVNAAVDPAVQALNITAGAQEEYEPERTLDAAAFGAMFGGGAKAGPRRSAISARAGGCHRRKRSRGCVTTKGAGY